MFYTKTKLKFGRHYNTCKVAQCHLIITKYFSIFSCSDSTSTTSTICDAIALLDIQMICLSLASLCGLSWLKHNRDMSYSEIIYSHMWKNPN